MGVAVRDYVVLAAVVLVAALLAALICGAGRRTPRRAVPTYHVGLVREADEGVVHHRVTLWNAGGAVLEADRTEDGDPLRIVASRGSEVRDAWVVTASRPENGVDVTFGPMSATCTFRYLCAGEGAVVDVVTAGRTRSVVLSGGFEDVPRGLRRVPSLVIGAGAWPPGPVDVRNRGLAAGAAIGTGLVLTWIAAVLWLRELRDSDRLAAALVVTLVAAVVWVLWYGRTLRLAREDRRRVPTALLPVPPG